MLQRSKPTTTTIASAGFLWLIPQNPGDCACTLGIRGKAGSRKSRGDPLRFGEGSERLGPVSTSGVSGWNVEISGTVPDDVSTWSITQDWESSGIMTFKGVDGDLVTSTTPVDRGTENLSAPKYPWAFQPKGGHSFYVLDTPGTLRSLYRNDKDMVSDYTVTNYTTHLTKGGMSRSIEWSITVTTTRRGMPGATFNPFHVRLP